MIVIKGNTWIPRASFNLNAGPLQKKQDGTISAQGPLGYFINQLAMIENEKRQIPRLKVLEGERAFGDYNNSIRSGSSLSSSVESNTMLLAGESYSSMCENEKIKIRRIVKNLIDTFNSSSSSSTFV